MLTCQGKEKHPLATARVSWKGVRALRQYTVVRKWELESWGPKLGCASPSRQQHFSESASAQIWSTISLCLPPGAEDAVETRWDHASDALWKVSYAIQMPDISSHKIFSAFLDRHKKLNEIWKSGTLGGQNLTSAIGHEFRFWGSDPNCGQAPLPFDKY